VLWLIDGQAKESGVGVVIISVFPQLGSFLLQENSGNSNIEFNL